MKKFYIRLVVDENLMAKAIVALSSAGFTPTVRELQPRVELAETPVKTPKSRVAPPRDRKMADSFMGAVALSVFRTLRMARGADFEEAFLRAGYQASSWGTAVQALVEEGAVVRVRRGVYRLPLDKDRLLITNGCGPASPRVVG